MGLFRKGNPAEKKLKELTGGFLLSNHFKDRLKEHGLSIDDGIKIKEQLKSEIKEGNLSENEVEKRLNQLINQLRINLNADSSKICPQCNKLQESDNTYCIGCGYEFADSSGEIECPHCGKKISKNQVICPFCFKRTDNEKTCPMCNKLQDKSNSYCIECGYDFVNKKVSDGQNVCPNCHNVQAISNTKCSDCGYDFKSKKMPKFLKTCPECKLVQKSANMFCRNCKHDLRHVDYDLCDELVECSNCGRMIPENKNICPFCRADYSSVKQRKPKEKRKKVDLNKLQKRDFRNKITFLHNFEFNLKTCPECDAKFLKEDPFCFNCGESVFDNDTVRNENLEVKDGKLVGRSESGPDDKLTDLESLYNQTIQSKYEPSFKIAYVLYLDSFKKNPSKKFSEKTAKKYGTTPNKLKKQALDDEFIELGSPLLEAKSLKVTDIKEILKQNGLKVSGKKDELIERLGENLSDEELKKYFKSKNYQISSKGDEFLLNNTYIMYIKSDNDISGALYPSDIAKIFEEKHYSQDEIYEKLLAYLKKVFDEKLTQELWVDFKIYANAIAQVQQDKGDLKEALNTRLKVFLFDINNFSVVLGKPDPKKTKLKQKDVAKLNQLLHELTLPIDELKELFEIAFDEVLFKTAIKKNDSLIYLLRVFGGEDLESISKEINGNYSNPH